MLCCWIEDPSSQAFKLHIPRIYDYLWIAEDGMKMQGHNGSQLWDTAFTVQAIYATGLVQEYAPTLYKTHYFINNSQVSIIFIHAYIKSVSKFDDLKNKRYML